MATTGCFSVTFFDTYKDAFYFGASETDNAEVVPDSFKISIQGFQHRIQCTDDKFLILNPEGEFKMQCLNKQQQHQPDCKFNIHIYQNSNLEERKGRAVMLYVNKDGRKMVACCSENNEIHPIAMDLPRNIEETAHKALFYMVELPASNKYMFESSVYQGRFLGFDPIEDNPSLHKVVLRDRGHDDVDENCELHLSSVHE